jgi:NTP pyrophosphatase (non-canonical NTP hydrolase)
MANRIVLLVTSPRLPAGLLTADAWLLLRTARVCAGAESAQVHAVRASGIAVDVIEPKVMALLSVAAEHPDVVWLAGPAGDGDLARELGVRLVREPALAELELMYGSWDPPGARLLDAVTVLDRLVGPGGDPWLSRYADPAGPGTDGLATYLLEEAYEAYDAVRSGDSHAVREELGDVLLQVVLHARIAALAAEDGFTIDDVAGDLVDKLVRRNPHVFGAVTITDLDEITRNWEQIKQEEKARTSVMDGMAMSQPALALAAKVLSRLERAGVPAAPSGPASSGPASSGPAVAMTERELGERLFRLVEAGRGDGLDAEAALRAVVLERIDAIRAEST